MKALWIENETLSYKEDVEEPAPSSGEALVRVRLAGVCGTDLELLRGYYPFRGIPGHEFVGEVVGLKRDAGIHSGPDGSPAGISGGEDAAGIGVKPGGAIASGPGSAWLGKRVVGEINLACGACPACRRGEPTHCDQRRVLGIRDYHGTFAELLVLPLRNLHTVPDSVPDETAVFTEPLAAAMEILEQVHLRPTDGVLVIGAGKLGQLAAQVLARAGCALQVVARHPTQRERLKALGIEALQEDQLPARQADVVVEATGSPEGFKLARQSVRPRGTIVLKSTYRGEISANLSAIVVDEITLVGSRCGPFPPALRAMEKGLIDPRPLIDGSYPLQEGLSAFAHASRPGILKILLQPAA